MAREHLEPLLLQRRELDLVGFREWVSVADGETKHFPPHESLAKPGRKRGHRYEGEVALSALQETGDIGAVDLAGADLEFRVALSQQVEERRGRLERGDQAVDEAQGACLAASSGLRPSHGPVGRGEQSLCVSEEDLAGRGQFDPSGAATQQGDGERGLERPDLLAHRLLGDVQILGGTREVPVLGDGHEVAHLPEIGGHDRAPILRLPPPALGPRTPRNDHGSDD
jgi:hypothetical protein